MSTVIDDTAENDCRSISLSIKDSPTGIKLTTDKKSVRRFSLPLIIPSDTNEDLTKINNSISNQTSGPFSLPRSIPRRLSLPIEYPWNEEGVHTHIIEEGRNTDIIEEDIHPYERNVQTL